MNDPTWFYIETAAASSSFPGQIEEGWFIVTEDGHVQLTNSQGRPLPGDGMRAKLEPGRGATAVASRLLKASKFSGGDFHKRFHRKIAYEPWRT